MTRREVAEYLTMQIEIPNSVFKKIQEKQIFLKKAEFSSKSSLIQSWNKYYQWGVMGRRTWGKTLIRRKELLYPELKNLKKTCGN